MDTAYGPTGGTLPEAFWESPSVSNLAGLKSTRKSQLWSSPHSALSVDKWEVGIGSYVVMPDHFHVLVGLPDTLVLTRIMQEP